MALAVHVLYRRKNSNPEIILNVSRAYRILQVTRAKQRQRITL